MFFSRIDKTLIFYPFFKQALENRTRDSKREMESIEKLEELRDKNTRTAASKFDYFKLFLVVVRIFN